MGWIHRWGKGTSSADISDGVACGEGGLSGDTVPRPESGVHAVAYVTSWAVSGNDGKVEDGRQFMADGHCGQSSRGGGNGERCPTQ